MHPIGRIYKLISSNGLIYIGSTTQTLPKRFSSHKYNYEHNGFISSKKLFTDNALVIIELIEEVQNITLEDLHLLEGKHMQNIECINEVKLFGKKTMCKVCNKEILKANKKSHEKSITHIRNIKTDSSAPCKD